MPTPGTVQDRPAPPVPALPGEYFTFMENEPLPDVALRDLADQLGLTQSALHQQARAGKIPTHKVRNIVFVSGQVATRIREWHQNNRNRTWPNFSNPDQQDP